MTNQASIVVAVWKERKISGAAKRLGLSVATVSRRLAEIEGDLGVVLFERNTRSLRATAVGNDLALRLERGLDEIDSAMRRVRDAEEFVAGLVRLAVPPNLAAVLAPIFATLRVKHPAVRLQIFASARRLAYADEDVDVLIRVGKLEEDSLVAKPLMSYRHVLCAARSVACGVLRPQDLKSTPALMWGTLRDPAPWRLERGDRVVLVKPEPACVTNDYDLIAALAQHESGVAELPALVAAPFFESGRLTRVLPEWQLPEIRMSIMYAAHRLLPRAVRAVVSHLRREFAVAPPDTTAAAER